MKLSQWKRMFQELTEGIQREVGMPIPALEEFRERIEEAAPIPEKRKVFEDEIDAFLESQPFLRDATSRYLGAKAARAIESSAALREQVRQVLAEEAMTTRKEDDAVDAEKAAAQLEVI